MKFIPKLFLIFIKIFLIVLIIYLFLNNSSVQYEINQVVDSWLKIVVPSISISYISSSFIYNYPLVSLILYPILKPVFHFENQKACSLYLISIIIGEPSITKLIINAQTNNEISINEANRLMRFTSFISPIFLIKMLGYEVGVTTIIIELLVSLMIGFFSNNNYFENKHQECHSFLDVYFNIINDLPRLLLGILASMIVITIFKSIFKSIMLSNFLEITSGLLNLITLSNSLIKFMLIQLLISTCGIAIIMQVYWLIRKTHISMLNFIKYRFVSVILTSICTLIIYLIILFI